MACPGGHMFYIGLYGENMKLLTFLSETTRPRALIFGMEHHLVDLYQVCSNYAPGAKSGHMFYIGLYRNNMKQPSRSRALIFGM